MRKYSLVNISRFINGQLVLRLLFARIMLMSFYLFVLGTILFVPSKFVRPPKEFRTLYGPNIRQTRLESFFSVKKHKN
jgi:hypothetical protein